ncbi:ribose-5-phosphate isomerase RpiA [Acuticoccus sp.]|uniref:ribose-5-phosphate isomerase RpiA n=1 Tax=Acuticoccus sp. TaxID=1904378 RepID=UPI003B52195E
MGEDKRRVAEAAALLVEPGMRLGLGSGSTALLFVEALGRRVADGLALPAAVATSRATEEAARRAGLAIADMAHEAAPTALDLAVDGADEVDPALDLVKGGGACLLREKIVAAMATRFVVIVDGSKRVARLGAFPLPVEVVPFAVAATREAIAARLGVRPTLRRVDGAPLLTDNGNLILDCPLGAIDDAQRVDAALRAVPGVVEHGLFLAMADDVLVGTRGDVERLTAPRQ